MSLLTPHQLSAFFLHKNIPLFLVTIFRGILKFEILFQELPSMVASDEAIDK
jgi:hypothetical protein